MGTDTVTLTKDGRAVEVPVDQSASLIQQGYRAEAPDVRAERIASEQAAERDPGAVVAGVMGGLRGLTLGGSDAIINGISKLSGDTSPIQALSDLRQRHGIASTIGTIAGAALPSLLTGGAGAEGEVGVLGGIPTPAGIVSNIGRKIAGAGESAGAIGQIGATAAAGAFEGAAQNAGGYISDVALGDRDLSADGFSGAMGKGALWGGVAGGALSVASKGLIAARRLLPAAEQTPEAVLAAENAAKQAVRDSVNDSHAVHQAGQEAVERTTRETDQLLKDLETERANFRAAREPLSETAPPRPTAEGETPPAPVAPQEPPPDAQQLMRNWRDKYPEGAVDYNAANASMRRGRLAAWAKDFQPTNAEDETIKAYFATPQDPMRTPDRIGGVEVPAQVQKLARNAAANASHEAYLTATPGAVDVSASGTEAMARSMYAGRKAAAQALDDVYTAYRAGMPIADIQIAATKKLTGEMHELAEARDDLLKSMAGKSETAAAAPQTLAERILSPGSPIDPDTAVGRALSKSSDVNADISDLAPKVTRYEAAKAQLTESIGPKASPEAQAHAQAFRAAQQHAETAGARGATQTAENIDRVAAGAPADKLPGGKSIFGKLADMGAVHEALSSVGIFKHALHAIPVIGPLLSVVLKAKLLGKLAGKFGGSFAETAEGTIAAKAAETQNRINGALDAMLGGTAKVLSKRAADTAQPAAALAHALFDNGSKKPYSSTPAAGDLGAMYQARMDELSRAMQPGAIEQAIKARITTSDPTIADAIIESQQRITSYLYNAAPKPDSPPLPGTAPRIPSKTEITNWGMAVAAVHDPAAVYERVAAGGTARPEEIDAVQNCFPALHAAAQQKLVKMLTDVKDPPNYARRVAISSLLGLPLDSSMMGEHATFLQSGYHTPAAQPQAPAATSTLSSSVNIGQRTLTGLDR